MLMKTSRQYRNAAGFSLVELMVALVASLIVIGAVLAFTLSSIRSNTQMMQAARLTEELREAIDYTSRELRRAGYDENAMDFYAQASGATTLTSPFANLLVTADGDGNGVSDDACVLYAYDRQPGNPGTVDYAIGEVRGIRRVVRTVAGRSVGVLEVGESSAATGALACNDASPDSSTYPSTCSTDGWCDLTDPRRLSITSFTVDTSNSPPSVPAAGSFTPLTMRDLRIGILGTPINATLGEQDVVVRGVRTEVRVRADCQRTSVNCYAAPVGS
jgi:type II secretory pathway component PulJ